jgi:hypothetical protein
MARVRLPDATLAHHLRLLGDVERDTRGADDARAVVGERLDVELVLTIAIRQRQMHRLAAQRALVRRECRSIGSIRAEVVAQRQPDQLAGMQVQRAQARARE